VPAPFARSLAPLLFLAACASPPAPSDAPAEPLLTFRLDAEPNAILAALRDVALAQGFRVAAETADTIEVDLGVAPCTVAAGGDGSARRTTEVHASAVFRVARAGDGPHASFVTLRPSSALWHPDRRAWVPATIGATPGLDLLTAAAGLP